MSFFKEQNFLCAQVRDNYMEILTANLPAAAVAFMSRHVDLNDNRDTVLLETGSPLNFSHIHSDSNPLGPEVGAIINIKKVNDAQYINKLFEATNLKLNNGGIYIGRAETSVARRSRIIKKYLFPFNYIYYCLDFLLKRIFPKVPVLKKIYFLITGGRNRVLSEIEIYGRLNCCGFTVLESTMINNLLYFVAEKIKEPAYDHQATYGPLIKLNRVGRGGKIIKVYKLRTMFAYSEYLQEIIYKQNSLDEGGKFKNDPRISTIGIFLRKCWLDELPMVYNMIKGEVKIVGVRPLSKHYYSLYPDSLQQLRIKTKPGLIPPFYADMPKTLAEIVISEERYLQEYLEKPMRTDMKYFYKAMYNIIIRKARSK